MKMPSRKSLTAIIFFGFIILFFGALAWYFSGFTSTGSSEFDETGESRGFSFFPFGRGGTDVIEVPDTSTSTGESVGVDTDGDGIIDTQIVQDRLRLVADVPTAAGIVFRQETDNNSLFDFTPTITNAMRYIEVETGHVYETTDKSLSNTRLTNTTIPRIREAEFLDGDSVIVRYVDPTTDVIKTFSAQVTEAVQEDLVDGAQQLGKLSGIFLPDNIVELVTSRAGDILYTQRESNGMIAVTTNAQGADKKQVFSSPLFEWRPNWDGPTGTISMTHYPSAVAYGMIQLLNRSTEAVTPFAWGERALDVKLSPDGERALVSYKTGNNISLFVKTAEGEFVDTDLNTLAEKCVWSSDSVLAYCAVPVNRVSSAAPDSWYRGEEIFNDDMWRVNTTDVTTRILFSPFEERSVELDIVEPKLSLDEKYMYFRDKQNLFFWTYQLELN